MDEVKIARVRRFNRTVAERLGALNDQFLGRDRPIGEARLLWEIGEEGQDVRALRVRLDLDSGYLSRLLHSLEAAGLVAVDPKPGDKRVRTVRLTRAGSAERAVLDERSDELAASFLAPLTRDQGERLVGAMSEVERLLTAAIVEVAPTGPADPAAQHCLRAYFTELGRRFDTGFDPARSLPADATELTLPAGLLLVARLHGEPVGCGAVKFHGGEPAEIKRMWVAEEARGLGLGRRILQELEDRAAAHGARVLRLETNDALKEAIGMYRSAGYDEVEPFNDEPYAHHWFEKRLPGRLAADRAAAAH
ncbi:helix-turn-helix domain-containing GNAT family N-acetyltransferase [Streptomyces pathocidini]|uniref:bifunctional helix-turn-helix transcriptional regulator/GNAT family N-acetyltransferase n=1 Tax=Streptomyces pathocidini TaxID=1650571 RepID=UPI0033ECBADE